MQMEDRERVITTLCAKLVEREQMSIEYDDEDYGDECNDHESLPGEKVGSGAKSNLVQVAKGSQGSGSGMKIRNWN